MDQLIFKESDYIAHLIYRSQKDNKEGNNIYNYIKDQDYIIINKKLIKAKDYFN